MEELRFLFAVLCSFALVLCYSIFIANANEYPYVIVTYFLGQIFYIFYTSCCFKKPKNTGLYGIYNRYNTGLFGLLRLYIGLLYIGLCTKRYTGLNTGLLYTGLNTGLLYTGLCTKRYTGLNTGLYTKRYTGLNTERYTGLYTERYTGLNTERYTGLNTGLKMYFCKKINVLLSFVRNMFKIFVSKVKNYIVKTFTTSFILNILQVAIGIFIGYIVLFNLPFLGAYEDIYYEMSILSE